MVSSLISNFIQYFITQFSAPAFPMMAPLFILMIALLSSPTTGTKMVNYIPNELSRSEILTYFRSVLRTKISTYDKVNEEVYSGETFPEDLYHNIETFMPHKLFSKYLQRTKSITDENDPKGYPLAQSSPGAECSPSSVFSKEIPEILRDLEGEKLKAYSELDKWHADNAKIPHQKICNRFLGLTCQNMKTANSEGAEGNSSTSCQCSGDDKDVGFFSRDKKTKGKSKGTYPTGCYIRPWRHCSHLSMDYAFRNYYYDFHLSLQNQRGLLTQMAFPVPRTHRCKQGTHCLDLIPGMKQPICWCSQDSTDEECLAPLQKLTVAVLPSGVELASIRRNFVKLFISVNESRNRCDPKLNGVVEKIVDATRGNPTETGVVELMKELIARKDENIRICDFRQSQYCDSGTKTCVMRCDPGSVQVGNGVCAVNNGFPCNPNTRCVERANCKQDGDTLTSTCVCEIGYGDKCQSDKPSFFGKLFRPVTSGFSGDEFIKLQETIHNTLKSLEDKMEKNGGEDCDPSLEPTALEIVKYFGNLHKYDKETGDKLLQNAQDLSSNASIPDLCQYTKFLRCDPSNRKCVPMLGSIQKTFKRKINVGIKNGEECAPLPEIFEGLVEISCSSGYSCDDGEGGTLTCQQDCNSESENCTRVKRQHVKSGMPHVDLPGKGNKSENVKKTPPPKAQADHPATAVLGGEQGSKNEANPNAPDLNPFIPNVDSAHPPEDAMPSLQDLINADDKQPEGPPPIFHDDKVAINAPGISVYLYAEYGRGIDAPCGEGSGNGTSLTCDEKLFLYCENSVCVCFPPLTYSEVHEKCMIPIGEFCTPEELSIHLPENMDPNGLECEYGKCLHDTVGEICRPASDKMLLFIPFEPK